MAASPAAVPRFTLNIALPIDKEYLRLIQRVAMEHHAAVPAWGENIRCAPEQGPTYWFDEKEWRVIPGQMPAHRVDLYTIQRGLLKVFDVERDVPIATRQFVLRTLYSQGDKQLWELLPQTAALIVQYALFDREVY